MLACKNSDMLSADANRTCIMSDITKLSQRKILQYTRLMSLLAAINTLKYKSHASWQLPPSVMLLSCSCKGC